MANYSFEKGKHGGTAGSIYPYFRVLSGNIPLGQDYKDYIPAGFLKCAGQILQADQYPQLAELLGVGNACIYRKEGTVLAEKNDNGTGGSFQLPDLGSKYIAASSNPGQYLNTTTVDTDTNTTVQRAGVEVSLEGNGDEIEFTYTGNFRSPGVSSLTISGNWRVVSPPSRTPATTLGISNFVAHAHDGTYTIANQTNLNSNALARAAFVFVPFVCLQNSNGKRCTSQSNYGVQLENIDFSDFGEDEDHDHPLGGVTLSQSQSASIPAVDISASGITTTVKMRTNTLSKIDSVAPKFIICEYLIKY